VLWVLVIGAALLTIAVFLVYQEQRAGGAGRRLQRTFTRAEAGMTDAMMEWTPGLLNRRLPGTLDSVITSGVDWRATIRKLNQGLYLAEVAAADSPQAGLASTATRQRIGRLFRVRPVTLTTTAALSAGGQVTLGTGTTIDGRDQAPAGEPDCPAPDSAIAGVVAAAVDALGSPLINGSPSIALRPPAESGLGASELEVFRELAAQATLVLPGGSWRPYPSSVGTACAVSASDNWGDATNARGACAGYMPIIHVSGDLELFPGQGQGILLVDGDLRLHGPGSFSGVVMARGRLEVVPGEPEIAVNGSVFAGSVLAQSPPNAVITITYSKCMVTKALLSSGRLIPLRSRSWKQLF
jgi:hypothetical protein